MIATSGNVVFPAPAGMNRSIGPSAASPKRVPRARGDEPHGLTEMRIYQMCSPRPRG